MLFKGGNLLLFIAAFFVALVLLMVIFMLHHKIEKLFNKLKLCEEKMSLEYILLWVLIIMFTALLAYIAWSDEIDL